MAYGTAAPAVNAFDSTATPRSLVAGSNAMIENVANQRGGFDGSSTPASGACAATPAQSARVRPIVDTHRFTMLSTSLSFVTTRSRCWKRADARPRREQLRSFGRASHNNRLEPERNGR